MLVPVTFSPRLVAAACVYHNAAQLVACAARAPPMRISSRQHAALSLSMSSRAFSLSLTSALSASPRRTLLTSSSARARNACFAIRSSGTRPVLARPNNSSRPSRSAVLGGPRRALGMWMVHAWGGRGGPILTGAAVSLECQFTHSQWNTH